MRISYRFSGGVDASSVEWKGFGMNQAHGDVTVVGRARLAACLVAVALMAVMTAPAAEARAEASTTEAHVRVAATNRTWPRSSSLRPCSPPDAADYAATFRS